MFRDAADPGMEHVFTAGADGFAELAGKWAAGYRWLDESTGTFLRHPSGRTAPPRRRAAHDYLADFI